MLDKMTIDTIKQGIQICKDRQLKAKIELSGNIELDSISKYSTLNIDRISIGRLTHSVKAIDFSLRLSPLSL